MSCEADEVSEEERSTTIRRFWRATRPLHLSISSVVHKLRTATMCLCVSPSAKLQSSNCAEYKCRWNSKCSDVKECRGHLFSGNNRNGWGMWSERGKSISTTEIYSIKTINNNRNHIELKWIYWDCIGQTTSVRSLAQFVIATCIPPLNGINAIESALRPKTFRFSRTEGHTKGENTFRVRIRR